MKMGKVYKGQELWEQLDGKKSEVRGTVGIEFAGVEGEVTVQFVDATNIDDIENKYEGMKTTKPTIQIPAKGGIKENIKVPSDIEKYERFNGHDKAKQWLRKNKPIENLKIYRMAYEFIDEKERPQAETPEEGAKILRDLITLMAANKIIRKGMEVSGFGERLDEAKNES